MLDKLKGHRTMLMTGFPLIVFTVLITYLALRGQDKELGIILGNLTVIGTFVIMLAGSAQFDKVASGVNAKLSQLKQAD